MSLVERKPVRPASRCLLLMLLVMMMMMTGVKGQLRQSFRVDGAQVNYFSQPGLQQSNVMVMQVQQTSSVTYIASPITSSLSQFVINNPRGLVFASQRANQRKQDLALQALGYKRIGLDSGRSGSSSGRHTIFIGTKPASMALMEDKTLIDFLLEEIFNAMRLDARQQAQALADIVVYNHQGDSNPSQPIFTSVTAAPPLSQASDSNRLRQEGRLECQTATRTSCDPTSPYRTADGTCNNLRHNLWGSSFIPMRRYLDPAYDDGISSPRTSSRVGGPLPSARVISLTLHPTKPAQESREVELQTLTHMVMQWGQFLDHDITSTPVQTAADGEALTCCEDEMPSNTRGVVDVSNRAACFPIPIMPDDPVQRGRRCFSFPRSVIVTNAECRQSPGEQLNQITSFVDASQVYGSSLEEQRELRTFGGKLKSSGRDGHLLPKDNKDSCVKNDPSRDYCFKAGDTRVNEQMALSSMHTVWLRQHNRLVDQLASLNPHWDQERLFQEARKIVGGLMQKITYNDWLPIILDQRRLNNFGLQPLNFGQTSNRYDPGTDPSIRNVFATAAYRFGHSLIRTTLSQKTANYQDAGEWRLESSFGNTSQILESEGLGVDMYMRGLLRDPPNMVDRYFTGDVKSNLFRDEHGNSLDLIAFNIQRGRDHGLPSYTAWRRYCGLRVPTSFNNMPDHDAQNAFNFANVYRSVDDIDVFSGGISERTEGGGLVGPTFACILSRQFSSLKFGDRFWFESSDANTGFTRDQVDELRRHSLSRVLCDVTAITQIQENPFRQVSLLNPLMRCQDIPEMDLQLWREGGRGFDPAAIWGTWGSWSQCLDGLQMRVRTCSHGNFGSVCSGSGQDSRACNDLDWTSFWSAWSDWQACSQGFQRRTRVCQGLSNPCPGSPEDIQLCRAPGSNTRNRPSSGWGEWSQWGSTCIQGRQWRRRSCTTSGNSGTFGLCSGPSAEARLCSRNRGNTGNGRGQSQFNFGNGRGQSQSNFRNGRGQFQSNQNGRGQSQSSNGGPFGVCYYLNVPVVC